MVQGTERDNLRSTGPTWRKCSTSGSISRVQFDDNDDGDGASGGDLNVDYLDGNDDKVYACS